MKKKQTTHAAEIILEGGTVITMEEPVEARKLDVSIAHGRILSVAEPGGLSALQGPSTKTVNVEGKTLLPGLIDAHNHMVRFGENLQRVEVSPAAVENMEDLVEKIKARSVDAPPGDWVRAWGYDDTKLAEGRHPNRNDLDRAGPDHPLSLMRTCLHVMAVNSLALEMAGIDESTPDPEGGEIGRDASGKPDGLLYELGAMNLINRLTPQPGAEMCVDAIGKASRVFASQGLTTVMEAGAGWSGNPHEAAGFQMAMQAGHLLQRVCLGLMADTYSLLPGNGGTGLCTGFGDDRLWIGPAKFVLDGGIGARTAALQNAYRGTEERGLLYEGLASLTERMAAVHRAGFQVAVHAIGDRAVETVLDAYESILSRYPRPHRHRVEHVSVCRADFFERFKRLGLTAVFQPAFIDNLGDSFLKNLRPEQLRYTLPIRTFLSWGIPVAGSSDRPVTDGNPWVGIRTAVNRKTNSGATVTLDEGIPVAEALKLYTTGAAYALEMEDSLGTIRPGKFADITVVDQNPLDADISSLDDMKTDMTYVGGRQIYPYVA